MPLLCLNTNIREAFFCAIELMKQLKVLQHKCDFGEVKANAIDYVLYVL